MKDCPFCDGSGEVDTGGQTPWGSFISVCCPSCEGSGRWTAAHEYAAEVIQKLEDGPNDWRSACEDPDYVWRLLFAAFRAGEEHQLRTPE